MKRTLVSLLAILVLAGYDHALAQAVDATRPGSGSGLPTRHYIVEPTENVAVVSYLSEPGRQLVTQGRRPVWLLPVIGAGAGAAVSAYMYWGGCLRVECMYLPVRPVLIGTLLGAAVGYVAEVVTAERESRRAR